MRVDLGGHRVSVVNGVETIAVLDRVPFRKSAQDFKPQVSGGDIEKTLN